MSSSNLVQEFADSILLEWHDDLCDFFEARKIFLAYPWRLNGVYQEGDKIRIRRDAVVEAYSNMPPHRIVSMGAFSYCRTSHIAPDFSAGRYCSIATGVALSDLEHPLDRISTHPFTTHPHMVDLAKREFGKSISLTPHRFELPAPVIGHDVWIGQGALIKRGITIGHGAVIGARSVVTKDVPPYAVVAGAPALIRRYRIEDEDLRQAMLDLRWWDYNYADFPATDPRDLPRFIRDLTAMVDSGEIQPFNPGTYNIVDDLMEHVGNTGAETSE